mmetsp:Transcript_7132/g.10846  ORF Transcript_7132/g.10846 Transcript_7132/m.10846 type:complete len:90 (-) Transcript_7132:963-1232(-)
MSTLATIELTSLVKLALGLKNDDALKLPPLGVSTSADRIERGVVLSSFFRCREEGVSRLGASRAPKSVSANPLPQNTFKSQLPTIWLAT